MSGQPCRTVYHRCFALALLIAGCATLNQTGSENFSSPSLWQPANVIQDARQLALQDASGSPEGIVDYMKARMIGVQPVFGDSMIFSLPGSRRVIQGGRFGDATGLGDSFWPDPRSDSGAYMITELRSLEDLPVNKGSAVMLPRHLLTSERIQQVIRHGTEAILSIGDVIWRFASAAGANALILEIAPHVLADLSRLSADSLVQGVLPAGGYRLPEPIHIENWINTYDSPLNVMGFIAGRDPQYASQLIVIAADPMSSASDSDFLQWMPSAVLLELARTYSAARAGGLFPRRSLLVATGTGAALQAVLEYPVWTRQNISAVLTPGRFGNGHLQVGRDTIPVFGYSFPELHDPDNLDAWITAILEDVHGKLKHLDDQPLEED